jgi:hypothetical protein
LGKATLNSNIEWLIGWNEYLEKSGNKPKADETDAQLVKVEDEVAFLKKLIKIIINSKIDSA